MPAGQVSHRMSIRPKTPSVKVAPIPAIANAVEVFSVVGKSKPVPSAEEAATEETANQTAIQNDKKAFDNALGSADKAFWNEVVSIDNSPAIDPSVNEYLRMVAPQFTDALTRDDAKSAVMVDIGQLEAERKAIDVRSPECSTENMEKFSGPDAAKLIAVCDTEGALERILDTLKAARCWASVQLDSTATNSQSQSRTSPQVQYSYDIAFMPINGCDDNAVHNFFAVSDTTETASNVQYLYNAQLSTSQVNAQLFTATFNPGPIIPPLQLVFSSTATSGSGQSNSSSTGSSSRLRRQDTSDTSSNSTDSPATTMAKLQAGGDFNVALPMPWLYKASNKQSISGYFAPNFGFNINGFSGQNTITEATEYSVNLPVEFYGQLYSIEKSSNGLPTANLFIDVKPAGEIISSQLAKAISPNTSRAFFIMQGAVGLELAQSIRISFQYFYSPKTIFQPDTASGTAATTAQSVNGFHLAVSFSPQNSKKSTN